MALPLRGCMASRTSFTVALIAASAILIFVTLLYSPTFRQYTPYRKFVPPISTLHECPPEAYAAGRWARKDAPPTMAHQDDVLNVSGFEGCASSREVSWHLGTSWDDADNAWKLQWRGNASAYDWVPGDGCQDYAKVTPHALLRQLVEEGGWLVLGDSITEGHFFSLSCMLYPHVRATPDYTIDPYYFDRAWPQNLYLNPSSPFLPQLNLPDGFEIDKTPLITFRRVDLLLGKSDLNALYSQLHPDQSPETLFSDEGVWDLDPATYLPEFLAPLPAANYRTLIVNTAGHWTTTVFSAFHTDSRSRGNGLHELLAFFHDAMQMWLDRTISALQQDKGRKGKQRQVVVRAYLHGHESCHDQNVELAGPLTKYGGLKGVWYNWNWIRRFNDAFQEIIARRAHPNVHFLSVDMPGLLRPDGHVQGDCLHVLTGAGIMEGWSEYLSYFISRLP